MAKQRKRLVLVAMIGAVGAGKTTVARLLAKRIGALHVRTDDIRARLARRGEPISRGIPAANTLLELALRHGRSVIADFDAVRPERQRELGELARRFGARIFFIRVRVPEKTIIERLRAQHYPIPGVFQDLRHALLAYYSRRRFHRKRLRIQPLFVIDNAKPLEPQVRRIVKEIQKLRN